MPAAPERRQPSVYGRGAFRHGRVEASDVRDFGIPVCSGPSSLEQKSAAGGLMDDDENAGRAPTGFPGDYFPMDIVLTTGLENRKRAVRRCMVDAENFFALQHRGSHG